MKHPLAVLAAALAVYFCSVGGSEAAVNLEWRPAAQVVHAGNAVNLGLYLVPDIADWPVSAMDVIVIHNTTHLEFQSLSAAGAPYNWLSSGFPNDPDNINKNRYDGDMLYQALAQLGSSNSAIVPLSGLLVTTFQFTARTVVNETAVNIAPTFGSSAKTAVYEGGTPNSDVTGTLGTARVMIVPLGVQIVLTAADARSLADGAQVGVVGPVVSRRFQSYFYIQDGSRASGIRVNCATAPPAEGSIPMVSGTLSIIDGERVIDGAVVGTSTLASVPRPLGMNLSSLRNGLSPQGLLITLVGRASSTPGTSSFVMNDGSINSVTVELHGFGAPDDAAFVAATGVLGADSNGPVLRVNKPADVRVLQG
ncbi:MAG: hypothetical protein HYX78_04190 [Armatimonadetes bacterium]|nr:hypothetical protein [Armatimonadota bacterium]